MADSQAGQEIANGLAKILFNIQVTRYTLIAGATVWAYDIFLTFHDEIAFLWAKGGILIKFLYLINRYFPIALLSTTLAQANVSGSITVPVSTCRAYYLVIGLCQMLGIVVATTIFTVRLYMTYYGNRTVQRAFILLAVASHITVVVCGFIFIRDIWNSMVYSDYLAICLTMNTPSPGLGGIYVTPIVLESVIAFATLWHAIKFWGQQRKQEQTSRITEIMNDLYINGLMYYFVVLALRIGVCVVYWAAPPSLILLLCYLEGFLTSLLTARWFLSFRRLLIRTLDPKRSTAGNTTGMTGAMITFLPPEGVYADGAGTKRLTAEDDEDEEDGDSYSLRETRKGPITVRFSTSLNHPSSLH